MIDGFLAKAAPPPLENVVALVAPHAGYLYSGQVAAYSYALLKGRKFDRVVVIAPVALRSLRLLLRVRRRRLHHPVRPGSGGPGFRSQARQR